MSNEMKLLKFMPKEGFKYSHLMFDAYEMYLPSEFVIEEPCVVAPAIARAYRTDFYVLDGEIVSCDVLQKISGFRGTIQYKNVYLLELWSNQGDDGHVDYCFEGYAFVTSDYIKGKKYPSIYGYRDGIVEFS